MAEGLSNTLNAITSILRDLWEYIATHEIAVRILYSILVIVTAALILKLYHRILKRMAAARIIESAAVEKLYRITLLVTTVLVTVAVAYALTKSVTAWVVAIAVLVVLLLSSWDYIVNALAYFFILSSRYIRQGDYVILNNSIRGRIREFTWFYTVLEDRGKVYLIPNKTLIRSITALLGEPSYAGIIVKVDGISGPEEVEDIRLSIENAVALKSSEILSLSHGFEGTAVIRVYTLRVSSESVTFRVEIPLPSPSPHTMTRRLSTVIYPIASVLRESGYRFTVELENGV